MRIVLSVLHMTSGKGGAERTAANLANELIVREHDVLIHSTSKAENASAYHLDPSIQHLKLSFDGGRNLQRIRECIRNFNPDLAFIFYYDADLVFQYAVFDSLGIGIGAQECTNPVRSVTNLAKSKRFGDVHCAFAGREALLGGMHGIRLTMESYLEKVPLICRPYTVAFPNAYRLGPGYSDQHPGGRKSIINVSGLKSVNKNGVVVAKAFANLAAKFPDWDLHYYGRGSLVDELLAFTRDRKLQDRIIWHGVTEDISSIYSRAQIHVIASYHEGNPNVVCEAMTYGVPSIGYADCSGTNELVRDEINGVLIKRDHEVANLASALERLMNDPPLREYYGRAAYEDAKALFEPRNIYDQWETLFKKIASYKGAAEKLLDEQRCIDRSQADHLADLRRRILSEGMSSSNRITAIKRRTRSAPLVSFVVPLFNKGRFIGQTIRSIARCDYPEKEIIVVDDCSTDNSAEVVSRLVKTIPCLRVMSHEKNRGLSAARNTGLGVAQGKYIQFWDADDVYSPSGLSLIVAEMEEDHSDVATGLALRNGKVPPWYKDGERSRRRVNFELAPEAFAANSSCFKVYRHEFLAEQQLNFVEGLYIQDAEFNLRAFPRARRITVTPYALGEYRNSTDSASKICSAARIESCFEINRLTREDYVSNGFQQFETFRQTKLITFVYAFFIKRLLWIQHGQFDKPNMGVLAPEMLQPVLVENFLQRFQALLNDYQDGISALASRDQWTAAACVALAEGKRECANFLFAKILKVETIDDLQLAAQRFGIEREMSWLRARASRVQSQQSDGGMRGGRMRKRAESSAPLESSRP